MDKDGNKIIWTVVIISAIAIIGLMFINFMPSQTSNIKTAMGNDLSSFRNDHKSDSSSRKSRSSSSSHTAVGTNLYTDTQNFDNLGSWWGSNLWTKTTDTYNGLAVMQTTQDWYGLSQFIPVKKGDVLTYSAYARYISGTGNSTIYWQLNKSTEGGYSTATANPSRNAVTITDSWQRISGTTVVNSDGYLHPRLERTDGNTNTLQIAGIKVEKGSEATPYTP